MGMVAQTSASQRHCGIKIGDREMTTTQVYLNTSDGYDYGPPSVRLALKFDLPDTITSKLTAGLPYRALELVFEQLNVGGDMVPAEPWTDQYRRQGNRSLSVGDVVVIGETAFSVASAGWTRLTTDQLLDAISRAHATTSVDDGVCSICNEPYLSMAASKQQQQR